MKNKELIPEGQLSIFDMQFTEKHKKVEEIEVSFTESNDFITKNKESFTNIEITEKQQKAIDKFKAASYVIRIILYAKGSIGIETKEQEGFKTHYINGEGKEEFSIESISPVLPWDRIIYHGQELSKLCLSKIQIDKLQKLLSRYRDRIKRVIHRKGDENLLIEASGKIISILHNGWQIEFQSIDHINCEEDEVYLIPTKIEEEIKKADPAEIQQKAKVGDYVQAMYGKGTIEGELYSEYNSRHTFSIIFENGTKHTAIPRVAITKILKSA